MNENKEQKLTEEVSTPTTETTTINNSELSMEELIIRIDDLCGAI